MRRDSFYSSGKVLLRVCVCVLYMLQVCRKGIAAGLWAAVIRQTWARSVYEMRPGAAEQMMPLDSTAYRSLAHQEVRANDSSHTCMNTHTGVNIIHLGVCIIAQRHVFLRADLRICKLDENWSGWSLMGHEAFCFESRKKLKQGFCAYTLQILRCDASTDCVWAIQQCDQSIWPIPCVSEQHREYYLLTKVFFWLPALTPHHQRTPSSEY